jgi:hypothetical protein
MFGDMVPNEIASMEVTMPIVKDFQRYQKSIHTLQPSEKQSPFLKQESEQKILTFGKIKKIYRH